MGNIRLDAHTIIGYGIHALEQAMFFKVTTVHHSHTDSHKGIDSVWCVPSEQVLWEHLMVRFHLKHNEDEEISTEIDAPEFDIQDRASKFGVTVEYSFGDTIRLTGAINDIIRTIRGDTFQEVSITYCGGALFSGITLFEWCEIEDALDVDTLRSVFADRYFDISS